MQIYLNKPAEKIFFWKMGTVRFRIVSQKKELLRNTNRRLVTSKWALEEVKTIFTIELNDNKDFLIIKAHR